MIDRTFLGWYYLCNGQRTGPVSTEVIETLMASGDVNPSGDVWSAWQYGKDVKFLPSHKRRLHVLVVDDDCDTADTTALLLKFWGHDTQVAYDGAAAFQAACASPPDVMLVDAVMPKINGCHLARKIREQKSCDGTLLIAITAYSDLEHRRLCLEAGFDHCFIKPVNIFGLHALLTVPADHIRPSLQSAERGG